MNILTAINRLTETGAGRVKELKDKAGEKRFRIHTVKNRQDSYR